MDEPSVHEGKNSKLGLGGWIAVVSMGVVLGITIWFSFWGWNQSDAILDTAGMTALIAGVVLSMLLGGGLMALLFYSNRKGYDR
jgi:hypothetical protein